MRTSFTDLAFDLEVANNHIVTLTDEKNSAYNERNCLVAALAHLFPAGIAKTTIEGWEPEWHNCVYIDTPAGQLSWHYHDSEAMAFADLPPYWGQWDGHTTAQKYERLAKLRELDILTAVTKGGKRG